MRSLTNILTPPPPKKKEKFRSELQIQFNFLNNFLHLAQHNYYDF